jgi:hypothetical protein
MALVRFTVNNSLLMDRSGDLLNNLKFSDVRQMLSQLSSAYELIAKRLEREFRELRREIETGRALTRICSPVSSKPLEPSATSQDFLYWHKHCPPSPDLHCLPKGFAPKCHA